ncbi:alpha/beta hydrolase [Paraburkholderia sp. J7]|uniref:alpha/beta fold hydrolase n=1 Tax=Paraburkholderia sp. J7 TaxID=2805438 RepID=UPI002AB7031A|nr:alpha/beta hydrolase [Paraburkholderia sp. J7]
MSGPRELQLETLQVGAIRMRVALQGAGPLVVFCHGFPESWVSWRAQMAAVADAGYRAAAPDMRGYGGTDAPADPAQYTMLHHAGDMVELVCVLGADTAVIVGHDWGAPAAWNSALLRPDVFRAVVGLSVPYVPPAKIDLLTALERQDVTTFYMQYFQQEGVAEEELQADVEATLRRVTFSMSGDGPGRMVAGILAPGAGLLENTVDPDVLPDWLLQDDLDYVVGEFRRTGFRGGLNWYRAIRRSAELLAPWYGCPIRQPSLFIGGSRDDVLKFPGMQQRVAALPQVLPGLRGAHVLEGAGHWLQRERAEEVNRLLLSFLSELDG